TEAIVVGFALGAALFIHRMSNTTAIESATPLVAEDRADTANGARKSYDSAAATDPEIVVYRISGALFFGAAGSIGSVLDRIADTHRALVIDFTAVPFLDSTAANMIGEMARKSRGRGVRVVLSGTSHAMREALFAHGIKPPLVAYERDVATALRKLKRA
ncbi:MAG: sodium-independent anion transporter, partial [Alphaproteobacteria bacterium]|nr:sodium-independent anion transporter [Alphaproteobacteria bacterium]